MPPLVSIAFPVVALVAGGLVYWDAVNRGTDRSISALLAFVVAGLFLAGSVPGLVALAISSEQAVQGFPTALRIVPGFVASAVYLYFR